MKRITIIHSNKGWYAKHNGNNITHFYGSRDALMTALTQQFKSITPINQ